MSEPATVVADIEQRALDGRQLRVMMAAAAYHARRIARTMRLGDAERDDIEQDIAVALLERRRFFDPSRGAWSSFADRVARQAAQGLADAIGAERRLNAGSLDGPDDGETKALRNAVELKLISASDSDVALSVAQFVDGLPKDVAHVARIVLLEEGEFSEAQRRSGLGNGEFFRKLREIRVQLVLSQIVRKRLSPEDTRKGN